MRLFRPRDDSHPAAAQAEAAHRVLLIDDDPDEYALTRGAFREFETNLALDWVDNYAAGLEAIRGDTHDAYLIDYRLGGESGIDLVRAARAGGSRAPLVMLTGQRDRETDVAAMEAGADDFLVKGRTDPALLERTIRYAIAHSAATTALEHSLEQMQALEGIGRQLEEGPTPEALDAVATVVTDTLGHGPVAIYLLDGQLTLAAGRGHAQPLTILDPHSGRLAQLLDGGTPAFVPNLSTDPDARRGAPVELAVPLRAHGATYGLLTVASPDERPISGGDYHTILTIADRLAVSLALSAERANLAARAARMDRLVRFAAAVGETLEPEALHQAVVDAAADVVPADYVGLTTAERAGEHVVRAAAGMPLTAGVSVPMPDWREGADPLTLIDDLPVADLPAGLGDAMAEDAPPLLVAAMSLVRDGRLIGTLNFVRRDRRRGFDASEQEAIRLMGGLTSLALRNVSAHVEIAERAVRDPLTGLPNRRFFDLAIAQLSAQRARGNAADRGPMAATMYDLDRFGMVNKQHGHQVGDEVLRAFGEVLAARTRKSDLVARYGGEEFVVVLLDATREDAMRIADEVRVAFAECSVSDAEGRPLHTTVSAGCAEIGPEETDLEALLRTADVALSVAKRAGRNLVMAA
jgi:diguanylate cyclase (GGDEF)-like protein